MSYTGKAPEFDTQLTGDDSAKVATTAYVKQEINAIPAGALNEPVVSFGIAYNTTIDNHTSVQDVLYMNGNITIGTGQTFTVSANTTLNIQ